MAVKRKKKTQEKTDSVIMTTKKVEEIMRKQNLGLKLNQNEKIWFSNNPGVRKAHMSFAMTDKEMIEYIRCKKSVHYFAQKYCKIKREDSTIGEIKLRDYQKDIISLFDENRFSILLASRQIGKCTSFKTKVKILTEDGIESIKTLGYLYYSELKKIKKLNFLEWVKFKIYSII
jgi:hypothetical protein